MPLDVFNRVVRRVAGSSTEPIIVRWRRWGRDFSCVVPGDNVWVCVKDDLLLREYEWMGADLDHPGDVVVDAGAHVGTFSVMAAERARTVVALEPNPAVRELLEQNIARNESTGVEVLDRALWGEDTELLLDVGAPSSAGSTLIGAAGGGPTSVPVRTVTLDELIERVGDIDLLKLDIEGAEFSVLGRATDAALRHVERIVGELHLFAHDGDGEGWLRDRLEGAGFRVDIRHGPFHHPASSLRAVRRNWPSLQGHLRLKMTVVVTYLAAAVLDPVFHVRKRLTHKQLRLFFAERTLT